MIASALPYWRRSVTARFGCTALTMLPALAVHGWTLDAGLFQRLGVLVAAGIIMAVVLTIQRFRHLASRCSGPSPQAGAWADQNDGGLMTSLFDAVVPAALLAALWPSTVALWPAIAALVFALIAQRLLGGWSVNPFAPSLLALAIAVALDRCVSDADFTPPLVSLFDAGIVAGAWLGAVVLLILLRLFPARAPFAFAVPAIAACISGGIPASSFVAAAVVAYALADTRHLPATRSGQVLVGAFAGLGTAALWLDGAPPVAIAFPTLLAFALAPWIERLTLPRAKPVT